jgi:RNA polymerase-binding transcription factor DksA
MKDVKNAINHLKALNFTGKQIDMAIVALEKQIPLKPTHEATKLDKYTCPSCKNVHEEKYPYCDFCGQRIDWD